MSALSVGDVAPRLLLPDNNGDTFDLYADDVTGRFVAIILCRDGVSKAASQLDRFAKSYDALRQMGVTTLAISHESSSTLADCKERLKLPFELLSDPDHSVLGLYNLAPDSVDADAHAVTVLLRPNQHILGIVREGHHDQFVLDSVSRELDAQQEIANGFQPPILVVPDVLTREDCRWLIDTYNQPGVPILSLKDLENTEINGDVKVKVADYDRQDRIDHLIVSEDVKSRVAGRIRSRLLREIKKSFHYTVATFEALRIACYEGHRGGRAHGHRDNSLPEVAHRRFAVSVNLNTDEFEGGEICFPEFGPRRYRPQTGAALVFSCSLLHEALAVTRGRRYVLLAFLNGNQ